jgi:hypothetical protein
MEVVRLIKLCLNETYSKIRIGKHLIIFLPKMAKKEMLYCYCF